MRGTTPMGIGGVFWLGPALLGVLLIVVGILIIIVPDLLRYAVAGLLMFAGMTLLGMGWRMRRQVTYRRVDTEHWRVTNPFDDE